MLKLLNILQKKSSDKKPEEMKPGSFSDLLAGKNVLITGAGKNIGRAIAHEMAQNRANIFFTDIDPDSVKKLKEELNQYPVASEGYISDISNPRDSDLLYKTLQKNQITIDILVNNAGTELKEHSYDYDSFNRWNKLFNINVFGPVHLTRLITQMMIDNHISGSVIFITSVHQSMISLNHAYSASKAALGMVIKELAIEFAPHNIRVNGIAPGQIREDENNKTIPHKYTPLHGSSISPCYIGRAAVYLSSDYFSKFTTGSILTIDGGLSLYNHLVDKRIQK